MVLPAILVLLRAKQPFLQHLEIIGCSRVSNFLGRSPCRQICRGSLLPTEHLLGERSVGGRRASSCRAEQQAINSVESFASRWSLLKHLAASWSNVLLNRLTEASRRWCGS